MITMQGFRTAEVSKLTGLSLRQIDHWDRSGLFKPSLAPSGGRGSARFYSFLDVVELKAAKKLLDAGLSTARLRKCLQYLRENISVDNLASASLVTDGKTVFKLMENDPQIMVDLLKKGQVAWAVRLESEEVKKAVLAEFPSRVQAQDMEPVSEKLQLRGGI